MGQRYIVRHGTMRLLGDFDAGESAAYAPRSRVVVRTERGHELGQILCETTDTALGMLTEPTQGDILRAVGPEDESAELRAKELSQKAFEACQRFVQARELSMALVDVEPLLGGERIIFYFLAEKRVDFRELVKDLAREFQTRIEMRQIGVRDEAKVLADYGDCGKPVCCNTHLSAMPPVSMRMAKLQKSTLDPSKISGRCGRLKCCLRYEMNVYEEFQQELPPAGSRIVTAKGQGKVLSQEILARKLLVEFEDGRRLIVAANEVLTRIG
jgi:cell fate regulator YaaT (PSP1 superfamily)